MTADTKATERPWSFDELGGSKPDGLGYIYGPGGHRYIDEITHHGVAHRSREENLANAALIVRAVNAHPNLLSVLKQIEDFSSDPTSVSLARAAREYVGALP